VRLCANATGVRSHKLIVVQKGRSFLWPTKIKSDTSATGHITTSYSETKVVGVSSPSFTGAPADALDTIEYEVGMFRRTLEILRKERSRLTEKVLENALVEDAVLHARQLCLAFIGDGLDPKTDITLADLVSDWEARGPLKDAVSRLKAAYGTNKDSASPRYAFNKGVMHATNIRGAWGAYGPHLGAVEPIIYEIVGHVESLTRVFRPIE
jgi:hypothetical protein